MENDSGIYVCARCGHTVVTSNGNPPEPIKWSDGHICVSWLTEKEYEKVQAWRKRET